MTIWLDEFSMAYAREWNRDGAIALEAWICPNAQMLVKGPPLALQRSPRKSACLKRDKQEWGREAEAA